MHIKAIPTKYKGIQFRSRLEAKWAAFFDLMNWKWQYEPCDFNGWIPDFAIYGSKSVVYAEVKPTVVFLRDIANEIDSSGCDNEVLLLGETCPIPEPHHDSFWCDVCALGWIREANGGDSETGVIEWEWQPCMFTKLNGKHGFCASDGTWTDRISGVYDKRSWCFPSLKTIQQNWALACNSSQWNKP